MINTKQIEQFEATHKVTSESTRFRSEQKHQIWDKRAKISNWSTDSTHSKYRSYPAHRCNLIDTNNPTAVAGTLCRTKDTQTLGSLQDLCSDFYMSCRLLQFGKIKPSSSQPSACFFSINASSTGLSAECLRRSLLKERPEKLLSTDVIQHLRSAGLDAYTYLLNYFRGDNLGEGFCFSSRTLT